MQCRLCGQDCVRACAIQKYCAACQKVHRKAYWRRYHDSAEDVCIGELFPCVICHTMTPRTAANQKYCSDTCYNTGNVQRNRTRHGRIRIVGSVFSCHACGNEGIRGRSWKQKYCSDTCRQEGQRTEKRERLGRTQFLGILFACAICGKETMRTSGTQIYCSSNCARTAMYRERARKIKAKIGLPYTRRQIFTRDRWQCQACWKRVRDNVSWQHPSRATVDHIIPLTKDGAECESNVQTLCWPCNHAKGNRVGPNDQLRLPFG